MSEVLAVAGLVVLLTIVLHAARVSPTVSTGQKITGTLWMSALVFGDALTLFRMIKGPRAEQSFWLPLESGLLILVVCTIVLAARFHRGWARMLADTWLVAGVLTQIAWAITLAAVPNLSDDGLLVELSQVAIALWLLALALSLLPGFSHMTPRLLGTLLSFFVLRASAMVVLFVASATNVTPLAWVAALLLVSAHTVMVISAPKELLETLNLQNTASAIPLQLPYAGAAISGGLTVMLMIFVPNVEQLSTFLLAGLNVVVLAVGQMLTAASNDRLVKTLRDRERYFRHLVRDSTDVILICGRDGTVEYLSPAAVRTMGLDPDTVIGNGLAHVLGIEPARAAAVIADALSGQQHISVESSKIVGGDQVFLETTVSAHEDRLVCNVRDTTERVRLLEQLHALAYYDTLTQLPNRAMITGLTEQAVRDLPMTPGGGPAVLYIDLDGFKKVNDAGGHDVGDSVLRDVGRRLRAGMPEECEVGRMGGDEFVVLVPDSRRSDPVELARTLIADISRPYVTHRGTFVIGVSVGIAGGGGPIDTPISVADLMRNADLAAYEAKRNREGWRRFNPAMLDLAVARAELDAEIAHALTGDRIFLVYQPMIELSTGRVVSAEALLRWRSSDGAVRSPVAMIDFAVRTGQAHALAERVLDMALGACAGWNSVAVSVNLTPAELLEPGFAEDVRAALAKHQVNPRRLTLEITEGTLLAEPGAAREMVTRLRHTGVRIAVDDFGNGYSSMAYLLDLPLDMLKIDKSVIERLGPNPQVDSVVAGILQLAATLSLSAVAQGVETAEQERHLLDLGCHFAQGYRFAEPLPALELEELARRHGDATAVSGSR